MTTVPRDDTGAELIRRTIRATWAALPVLLLADVLVCLCATLAVLVAPGLSPALVLLSAVVITPGLVALLASVDAVNDDRDARISLWWRALRQYGLRAVGHALVAAAAVSLLLCALLVWDGGRRGWALPSLAVTGGVAVCAAVAVAVVLPLLVIRPELRGLQLWLTACRLVVDRPVRVAAALTVVALGGWAGMTFSASLLLLLPIPAAVVLVLAVRTAVAEGR